MQIEVEDAEVMPFPTTRQTLQEMLMDEEEKDFWDDAEPAPAQERATVADAPGVKRWGTVRYSSIIVEYVSPIFRYAYDIPIRYFGVEIGFFHGLLQHIAMGYCDIELPYYDVPIGYNDITMRCYDILIQ